MPFIKRRGPDNQGIWVSDDGVVVMLQARLSIVDRDPRADQPFVAKDRSIVVGFVGEIYNYGELKNHFNDYSFRTESDTEVISAAYARMGIAGLKLLKGMYTIALVDRARSRVFLARDPVGKKPLYIATWHDQVLFGSSVLPLFAAGGGEAAIDENILVSYWKNGYVPADQSTIVGVVPVMPGEVIELDWSGKVVDKHDCSPVPDFLYDGEQLVDVRNNVKKLLRTAIKRRLTNNPEPISLLSGGLDSTIVTTGAQTALGNLGTDKELTTLTLGAVVPYTNDERYASYAARKLGLKNNVLRLEYGSLGHSVLHALDIQDEPLAMPSYFLLERLVSLASKYGHILLTGDGGDEVFLGYQSPEHWLNPESNGNYEKWDYSYKLSSSDWMSSWGRGVAGPGFVGHMLAKADRASAEQGVEIRCPLLDWDLICYTRSLHFDMLTNGNRSKALLKDILGDWPSWYINRKKRGFTYNLRWLWRFSQYAGMRENIQISTIEMFDELVPQPLRKPPLNWSNGDIFNNFIYAWRLLSWSRFEDRMTLARAASS